MTTTSSRRRLMQAGACLFTLALTVFPVLAPPPGGERAFAGEQAAVAAEARRIVGVGGSVTEIVYALGEQDRLVARDSTSQFPEAALKLPDIGYMRALSPEGVLSVNPDAIIALEGSGPPEAVDVLEKASVPMVVVPETFDRDGILAKIRTVGAAIGADDKAEALAREVGSELDAARALTEGIAEPRRVLFILSIQGGKVLASGTGTAADGIIALAGGQNVITEFEGYKQLTDEAVINARPDVILMMDRGGPDHGPVADQLFSNPAVAATPAGASKRLIRMDGNYLLGFGPRTAAAARDLAASLYGDKITH
ncbi:heme/hemin ABC transporter substrate-binding protein [Mesorhizobium xinjiangense]|uniref:heme/hemin ABC transporter substrate-binding protein n=1 Tax=Mesorhizobium xinjiangense TaxID=2678685 RepID=UPI0012ED43DA|nr:ABC transporter substrate-binding protein [Mesorhizobium xinjiangense]